MNQDDRSGEARDAEWYSGEGISSSRENPADVARNLKIEAIYISPGHNFFGHHGKPAGTNEAVSVQEVECVAGRGLKGDRFFDYKPGYGGQITFFAREVHDAVCRDLGVRGVPPSVYRRNVITSGVDLNALIGKEFEVQGVRFFGYAECTPCYWMDRAVSAGAEKRLKGNGGLRARILTDGVLRVEASA